MCLSIPPLLFDASSARRHFQAAHLLHSAPQSHKKKPSLCVSHEAVGIALTETQREEAHLRLPPSVVCLETSYISCDDRFAVAN